MARTVSISDVSPRSAVGRYFASGWAFLVPYAAIYAIYAALGGPIHHATGAVPALLHVFWALHIVHALLGLGWAWSAWGSTPPRDRRRAAWPWFATALLLWLPGVYLEFPADPWTHFARINEWHLRDAIADHTAGLKSSYLLAYSLFGFLPPGRLEFACLTLFSTATGLLLLWQYHLLARAVGLGRTASFIFALLTLLVSGNNLFAFHRYYGISSSVFAQIGLIAGVRLLCEVAKRMIATSAAAPQAAPKFFLGLGGAVLLIALNHLQALAMLALGGAAIAAW